MKGAMRRSAPSTLRAAQPRAAPGAFVITALAAAALVGGCADRACFQWSAEEGVCPSQSEALSFMPTLDCIDFENNEHAVKSVDSEGDFDTDVCCYDVTFANENKDCFEDF